MSNTQKSRSSLTPGNEEENIHVDIASSHSEGTSRSPSPLSPPKKRPKNAQKTPSSQNTNQTPQESRQSSQLALLGRVKQLKVKKLMNKYKWKDEPKSARKRHKARPVASPRSPRKPELYHEEKNMARNSISPKQQPFEAKEPWKGDGLLESLRENSREISRGYEEDRRRRDEERVREIEKRFKIVDLGSGDEYEDSGQGGLSKRSQRGQRARRPRADSREASRRSRRSNGRSKSRNQSKELKRSKKSISESSEALSASVHSYRSEDSYSGGENYPEPNTRTKGVTTFEEMMKRNNFFEGIKLPTSSNTNRLRSRSESGSQSVERMKSRKRAKNPESARKKRKDSIHDILTKKKQFETAQTHPVPLSHRDAKKGQKASKKAREKSKERRRLKYTQKAKNRAVKLGLGGRAIQSSRGVEYKAGKRLERHSEQNQPNSGSQSARHTLIARGDGRRGEGGLGQSERSRSSRRRGLKLENKLYSISTINNPQNAEKGKKQSRSRDPATRYYSRDLLRRFDSPRRGYRRFQQKPKSGQSQPPEEEHKSRTAKSLEAKGKLIAFAKQNQRLLYKIGLAKTKENQASSSPKKGKRHRGKSRKRRSGKKKRPRSLRELFPLIATIRDLRDCSQAAQRLQRARVMIRRSGVVEAFAVNSFEGSVSDQNEDRVSIILNAQEKVKSLVSKGVRESSVFAVYDGHGGIGCCSYLKRCLHLRLLQELDLANLKDGINSGCLQVDQQFFERVEKRGFKDNSGSSALILMILGKKNNFENIKNFNFH